LENRSGIAILGIKERSRQCQKKDSMSSQMEANGAFAEREPLELLELMPHNKKQLSMQKLLQETRIPNFMSMVEMAEFVSEIHTATIPAQ
jgi:hypothetical protein